MSSKKSKTIVRATAPVIERLEERRLFAATLALTNLEGLPANDRIIFDRIQTPNETFGNRVHDTSTVRLTNSGNTTLTISSLELNGPWEFVNATNGNYAGVQIAAGSSLDVVLKFNQSTLPAHSVNETNFTTNPNGGATITGSLIVNSNATNSRKAVTLAGYWQSESENNAEPNLQTIVNRVFGYQTVINSTPIVDLSQGTTTRTLYGEEVSTYDTDPSTDTGWMVADPTKSVVVRQIASYHTQGNTVRTYWTDKGTSNAHTIFNSRQDEGQTMLPHGQQIVTNPLQGSFKPSGAFHFRIDTEYSEDNINIIKGNNRGGGHHVRFFPLRDSAGNVVANSYIMAMDYAVTQTQNYDFQDNVYIVSNMRPAQVPPAPDSLTASRNGSTIVLDWADVSFSGLTGYNVYRSTTSASSGFTKLNGSVLTNSNFTDNSAPSGTVWYQVKAVGGNGAIESGAAGFVVPSLTSAPIANDDSFNTNRNEAVNFDILSNDTVTNGGSLALNTIIASNPSNGTRTVDTTTGQITYTPNNGFSGTDTFTYTVRDNDGTISNSATVTINVVSPAATTLVVNDDTGKVLLNSNATFNVLGNDVTGGTFNVSGMTVSTPGRGTAVKNDDGTITYTPNTNFIGQDSFTYTVSDGTGTQTGDVVVNVGAQVGSGANKQYIVYTAANGTIGTVTLNLGTANVYFAGANTATVTGRKITIVGPGSNPRISSVELSGTTIRSAFVIKGTRGTRDLSLGSISSSSVIGKVIAAQSNLTGDVNLASASVLQFKSINGTAFTVGAGAPKLSLISLGAVQSASLTSSIPVALIKAPSWTNEDNANQNIIAPSLNALAIAGNFDSSIELTGTGTAAPTLNSAVIRGAIGDGFWDINGNVRGVSINSASPSWGIDAAGALNALVIRSGGLASDVEADTIRAMTVVGDFTGNVNATSVRAIVVKGNINDSNIVLTGTGTTPSLYSLAATGTISNTSIQAAGNINAIVGGAMQNVTITGATLRALVAKGNFTTSTIDLTGTGAVPALYSFKSTGDLSASTIHTAGNINAVVAASITGSSIAAGLSASLGINDVNSTNIGTSTINVVKTTTRNVAFSNSRIMAQTVKATALGTVDTDNSGVPEGVVADVLNSVVARINGKVFRAGPRQLVDQATLDSYVATFGEDLGDFKVKVL